MSDTQDPQDIAEALDSDKLPGGDDPDVEPEYPLDEPLGVEEYGLTSAEESIDEPLEERVARETPDPLVQALEDEAAAVGDGDPDEERLDPGAATDGAPSLDVLDEADLSAEPGPAVGRLVEADADEDGLPLLDEEPESVGTAAPDQLDLSAEELAMHLTDDPAAGEPG
jgi:hypothetical protein